MITAIDVGATKTLIAQFNNQAIPINEIKFPTPTDTDAFLHELSSCLSTLARPSIIVVGVPGMVSSRGTIIKCGNLPWKRFALGSILQHTYHCPVFIENDAKLAALSEINSLNPVPPLGLYLTLSTGIGSGVIIDGKLIPHFRDSEAGHMIIQTPHGPLTWQQLASGTALKKQFGKLARDIHEPSQWEWFAHHVALGLEALIPAIQPNVIIFGGGVGHYFKEFEQPLRAELERTLPKYITLPHLITANHPDEAVIYGCYYHATHQSS